MGRPDFDVPNDKSLAESKEYWEDQLESGEEMLASAETDEEKENAFYVRREKIKSGGF